MSTTNNYFGEKSKRKKNSLSKTRETITRSTSYLTFFQDGKIYDNVNKQYIQRTNRYNDLVSGDLLTKSNTISSLEKLENEKGSIYAINGGVYLNKTGFVNPILLSTNTSNNNIPIIKFNNYGTLSVIYNNSTFVETIGVKSSVSDDFKILIGEDHNQKPLITSVGKLTSTTVYQEASSFLQPGKQLKEYDSLLAGSSKLSCYPNRLDIKNSLGDVSTIITGGNLLVVEDGILKFKDYNLNTIWSARSYNELTNIPLEIKTDGSLMMGNIKLYPPTNYSTVRPGIDVVSSVKNVANFDTISPSKGGTINIKDDGIYYETTKLLNSVSKPMLTLTDKGQLLLTTMSPFNKVYYGKDGPLDTYYLDYEPLVGFWISNSNGIYERYDKNIRYLTEMTIDMSFRNTTLVSPDGSKRLEYSYGGGIILRTGNFSSYDKLFAPDIKIPLNFSIDYLTKEIKYGNYGFGVYALFDSVDNKITLGNDGTLKLNNLTFYPPTSVVVSATTKISSTTSPDLTNTLNQYNKLLVNGYSLVVENNSIIYKTPSGLVTNLTSDSINTNEKIKYATLNLQSGSMDVYGVGDNVLTYFGINPAELASPLTTSAYITINSYGEVLIVDGVKNYRIYPRYVDFKPLENTKNYFSYDNLPQKQFKIRSANKAMGYLKVGTKDASMTDPNAYRAINDSIGDIFIAYKNLDNSLFIKKLGTNIFLEVNPSGIINPQNYTDGRIYFYDKTTTTDYNKLFIRPYSSNPSYNKIEGSGSLFLISENAGYQVSTATSNDRSAFFFSFEEVPITINTILQLNSSLSSLNGINDALTYKNTVTGKTYYLKLEPDGHLKILEDLAVKTVLTSTPVLNPDRYSVKLDFTKGNLVLINNDNPTIQNVVVRGGLPGETSYICKLDGDGNIVMNNVTVSPTKKTYLTSTTNNVNNNSNILYYNSSLVYNTKQMTCVNNLVLFGDTAVVTFAAGSRPLIKIFDNGALKFYDTANDCLELTTTLFNDTVSDINIYNLTIDDNAVYIAKSADTNFNTNNLIFHSQIFPKLTDVNRLLIGESLLGKRLTGVDGNATTNPYFVLSRKGYLFKVVPNGGRYNGFPLSFGGSYPSYGTFNVSVDGGISYGDNTILKYIPTSVDNTKIITSGQYGNLYAVGLKDDKSYNGVNINMNRVNVAGSSLSSNMTNIISSDIEDYDLSALTPNSILHNMKFTSGTNYIEINNQEVNFGDSISLQKYNILTGLNIGTSRPFIRLNSDSTLDILACGSISSTNPTGQIIKKLSPSSTLALKVYSLSLNYPTIYTKDSLSSYAIYKVPQSFTGIQSLTGGDVLLTNTRLKSVDNSYSFGVNNTGQITILNNNLGTEKILTSSTALGLPLKITSDGSIYFVYSSGAMIMLFPKIFRNSTPFSYTVNSLGELRCNDVLVYPIPEKQALFSPLDDGVIRNDNILLPQNVLSSNNGSWYTYGGSVNLSTASKPTQLTTGLIPLKTLYTNRNGQLIVYTDTVGSGETISSQQEIIGPVGEPGYYKYVLDKFCIWSILTTNPKKYTRLNPSILPAVSTYQVLNSTVSANPDYTESSVILDNALYGYSTNFLTLGYKGSLRCYNPVFPFDSVWELPGDETVEYPRLRQNVKTGIITFSNTNNVIGYAKIINGNSSYTVSPTTGNLVISSVEGNFKIYSKVPTRSSITSNLYTTYTEDNVITNNEELSSGTVKLTISNNDILFNGSIIYSLPTTAVGRPFIRINTVGQMEIRDLVGTVYKTFGIAGVNGTYVMTVDAVNSRIISSGPSVIQVYPETSAPVTTTTTTTTTVVPTTTNSTTSTTSTTNPLITGTSTLRNLLNITSSNGFLAGYEADKFVDTYSATFGHTNESLSPTTVKLNINFKDPSTGLNTFYLVNSINFINRQDCCQDRINNSELIWYYNISETDFTTIPVTFIDKSLNGTTFDNPNRSKPVYKIVLNNKTLNPDGRNMIYPINLAEISVDGKLSQTSSSSLKKNLAFSSSYGYLPGYPFVNLIDNNMDTFGHTNFPAGVASPDLTISLGYYTKGCIVDYIELFNRRDCCQDRISGATIYWNYTTPTTNNITSISTVSIDGTKFFNPNPSSVVTSIKIVSKLENINLAEIDVVGYPV